MITIYNANYINININIISILNYRYKYKYRVINKFRSLKYNKLSGMISHII